MRTALKDTVTFATLTRVTTPIQLGPISLIAEYEESLGWSRQECQGSIITAAYLELGDSFCAKVLGFPGHNAESGVRY